MQEISKTLAAILENEWNLTGRLEKSKITFRRGEPFDLTTRFTKRPISIEVSKLTRPLRKRTLARSISRELATVSVWLLIRPQTNKHVLTLLDDRQKIEDEIERIVKAQQRALTDIDFSFASNARYLDRYDEDPPTLRVIFDIKCQYQK